MVINADDFGLHPAVNRAVERAVLGGVVTSASLMACGRAFEDAVTVAQRLSALSIGVHLTLVEERPLTAAPSLIGAGGTMPPLSHDFAHRWLSGHVRREEVRRELTAQIERVISVGIRPSHLDSHQHVHALPGLWRLTMELARTFSIPFVRVPSFDGIGAPRSSAATRIVRAGLNALAARRRSHPAVGVRHADRLHGTTASGRMTVDLLLQLMNAAAPGITEIMVHPVEDDPEFRAEYKWTSWADFDGRRDLAAVTAPEVRARAARGDLVLSGFAALAAAG